MQNDTNDEGINPKPNEINPIETQPAEISQYESFEPAQPIQPAAEATPYRAEPSLAPASTPDPVLAPTPFFPSAVGGETPVGPIGSGPADDTPLAVQPPKKSKKKLIVIGSIIAGALLILGGGSALAYNVWYQNPEKVVTDALVSAMTAKTAQLTGSFEVDSDENQLKVTFGFDSDSKSSELAVKLDYTADGQTFKMDGAGHFDAEGDLYVKVNNVNDLIDTLAGDSGISLVAFDDLVKKVEGKWIKITNEDIGEFSEEYKKTQKCLEDVTKEIADNGSVRNELIDLYKDNRFVVIGESLGSRTIKDVGSLGYVVDLDVEKAKVFAAGLESTEAGKKLKACDDTIDFKEFANSLEADKDTDSSTNASVQVWASRFGHELTEVNASGKDEEAEVKAVVNPVFNKELNIKTPTDAMSVETLKAEFEKALEAYYTEYQAELYS